MRRCGIEGCDRKHYGRGMCKAHWNRARRGSSLTTPIGVRPPRSVEECSVAVCDRPVRTRGLCSAHYMRKLRGTELKSEIREYRQDP